MWDLFVFACLMVLVIASAFAEQRAQREERATIYHSADLAEQIAALPGHKTF